MRTTISLAEDRLIAARNIAQREKISLGDAVSEPHGAADLLTCQRRTKC